MKRPFGLIGLALAACATYAAEPLGRLFYTPAQRAQLDALRSQKNVVPPTPEPQPTVVPEAVSYDGVVRRSDGKTTVWINQRPVNDGKPAEGLPLASRVHPDHRIRLRLPQDGREFELKVGQTVDVGSGSIVDAYARDPIENASTKATSSVPVAPPSPGVPPPSRRDPGEENEGRAPR